MLAKQTLTRTPLSLASSENENDFEEDTDKQELESEAGGGTDGEYNDKNPEGPMVVQEAHVVRQRHTKR